MGIVTSQMSGILIVVVTTNITATSLLHITGGGGTGDWRIPSTKGQQCGGKCDHVMMLQCYVPSTPVIVKSCEMLLFEDCDLTGYRLYFTKYMHVHAQ